MTASPASEHAAVDRTPQATRCYHFGFLDADNITGADQASIAQLYALYFGELGLVFDPSLDPDFTHPQKYYGQSVRGAYLVLRCSDDVAAAGGGRIVGVVGIRDLSDPSNTLLGANCCEMKRLFVHPDYRGGGRGRTLVESILQKSRQLGYRRCVLDTKAKLAAANKLYAVLGFVAWGNYNANPRADLFYALNFVEAPGDETVG